MAKTAVVTGAGGFIGHHLVRFLKEKSYWVRGVDLKRPEFEESSADEFIQLDLRNCENCLKATSQMQEVYALAADMGGMGYISQNQASILFNNTLISFHTLEAARTNECSRVFFASSACIYPAYKQRQTNAVALKEVDAYPAEPQESYGWEKLTTEQLFQHYKRDFKLETRIARLHNVYGPLGAWHGGKEKAPSALCRKVVEAKLNGSKEVEIWGDGNQQRSFCYIDDCLEGIFKIMQSHYDQPINLGRDELVSIKQMLQIISEIADYPVQMINIDGPIGVTSRNSDNTLIKDQLGWCPSIGIREGLEKTYPWVERQLQSQV